MEFRVPRQNSISPTSLLRYKWSYLSDEQSLWRMLRIRVSPVHELAVRNQINPTQVSNLLSMALCLTIAFDFTVILFFPSHLPWKPSDVICKSHKVEKKSLSRKSLLHSILLKLFWGVFPFISSSCTYISSIITHQVHAHCDRVTYHKPNITEIACV